MSLKIFINDKIYYAEKGEYILDVCRRNNIFVHTLCHHESLCGLGSCRLCVVEVDEGKGNRTVISCVYPLSCDCKVLTESKKIIGIRKTILSMLQTRAPKGEGLSSLCQIYNVEQDTRFAPAVKLPAESKTDKGSSLVQQSFGHLAMSCILCGLCTQACASLGTGAISTVGRGVEKKFLLLTTSRHPAALAVLAAHLFVPQPRLFSPNPMERVQSGEGSSGCLTVIHAVNRLPRRKNTRCLKKRLPRKTQMICLRTFYVKNAAEKKAQMFSRMLLGCVVHKTLFRIRNTRLI